MTQQADFSWAGLLNSWACLRDAVQEGQEWGHQFIRDPQWQGDRDRMANHAIYEASFWSFGTGVVTGLMGWFGLIPDLSYFAYSQTKLTAALFTIYGLDVEDENVLRVLIAVASGVTANQLADYFGAELCRQVFSTVVRRSVKKNFPQLLQKVIQQLPRPLAQRIIGRVASKSVMVRALPLIGGVIGGGTNAITMNVFGHGVCALIKTFQSRPSARPPEQEATPEPS
ncbi:MAG: hypothetical protein KatS3mg067_0395 [Thermosynechococcus sp.]|uniref:EcsC family protein n=1 Tax=Thermosynechococcus sp. TaxID=2814275 RepID=UPI002208961A|nr:EcsC family protein [Thermosynechococcus sp.]BCX11457.1 MAG: hypothetical protein KatS3mg067_0395 [Thermosynechococcus sp.]